MGLQGHEFPLLTASSQAILEVGMVLTIEPGVYLNGIGGARVEDTLVITKTGCKSLTKLPRELRNLNEIQKPEIL
ncbi:M24 family metallopeptidase [Vibrio ichthyoenteri]|nr:M24 family metallopeptidase [Vibrio ichthyoenteri]